MLDIIVSELGSIKELLDKEKQPLFFDREFSFLATGPALLYLFNADRIVYLNKSFTEALGYTPEDLAATQYNGEEIFCHRSRDKFLDLLRQAKPGYISSGEFCLKHRNGTEADWHIVTRELYKGCYELRFDLVPGVDAGEKELVDRVKNELKNTNRELEEFAYIASHDLQEPLRKITTFIQRLEQKLGASHDEDIALYIKRIQASADNMRNLIDNLLEFSRAGRNSEPAQDVAVSDIISKLVSDPLMKIAETGSEVSCGKLPVVEAVPSQMIQLFRHVLHNAIKFRKPDEPLTISVTSAELTDEEKARHQFSGNEQYHIITVADNGIGFEQAYAEKIFQLFQRLHGKHEYPGTGIGLSICRKIVSKHGGYMFAEGEPGSGSRFSIILPKHHTADV